MAFAEFIAENLLSLATLTWDYRFPSEAQAIFAVENTRVTVEFKERAAEEWVLSFTTLTTGPAEPHQAFYIFNGVFQSAEEFIAVRAPARLVFATKRPELSHIYQTYLNREQGRIEGLGYRLLDVQRVEPFSEFVLERVKLSNWNLWQQARVSLAVFERCFKVISRFCVEDI